MDKRLIKASKFLSLVLRHQPEAIGLSLDHAGWASIDQLVAKSDGRLSIDVILEAVAQNDKKRFAISDDGRFIRANQGHSVNVDLGFEPVEPPTVLFHGTADRFLESILEQGLTAQSRQHVHLSPGRKTAVSVGQRHGRPVVLTVASGDMQAAGYAFYLSRNGVWLTDAVPPEYLSQDPQ